MQLIIKHLATTKDWERHHEKIDSPICLVLGSFNPAIPSNSAVPFYYCRRPRAGRGNRFWPSISEVLSLEGNLIENGDTRLKSMQAGKFIFMDLIDELVITSANADAIESYRDEQIDSFSDSALWASRKNIRGHKVTISRNYNTRIFDVISRYQSSLRYVVFTLGPSGLGPLTKRKKNGSLSRREPRWVEFYQKLEGICSAQKPSILITETCSPSPQGGCSDDKLRGWLKEYVIGQNLHEDLV
jgi:hypothetical protein